MSSNQTAKIFPNLIRCCWCCNRGTVVIIHYFETDDETEGWGWGMRDGVGHL